VTREQDDERVAHLTHVSEIKKKSEALAKTTATLQDVIHNKVSEKTTLSSLYLHLVHSNEVFDACGAILILQTASRYFIQHTLASLTRRYLSHMFHTCVWTRGFTAPNDDSDIGFSYLASCCK